MTYTQKAPEPLYRRDGYHEQHHSDGSHHVQHHEQHHEQHHAHDHHHHHSHQEEHRHEPQYQDDTHHHHHHHQHFQQEEKHHEWYPPIPPKLEQLHWHEEHKQRQHHTEHHHHHQEQHHHHVHLQQEDSHQHHHHHHHEQHHDQKEAHQHHQHHGQREDHQEQHHHQHQQDHGPQHHEPPPPIHYNPHHLTDYHYYVPPPPPKIPELPEPETPRFDRSDAADYQWTEEQPHPRSDQSNVNPHHLTDYRYRLPAAATTFREILPPPQGLPDLYYENAWDKPEDPRKMHPMIEPVPVVVVATEERDVGSPYPSGKAHAVFPWESTSSQARSSEATGRKVTRKFYNYTAHQEARTRQREQELVNRLELEEAALAKIQKEESERFERERAREEAHRRATGHHALESFRLVNAWDVDVGVQMSILQKTEQKQQRKPRSRKSSGALRRGYSIEDVLALEAKQKQEQYEAELQRKQIEEEERFLREQEEARIAEEAARQARIRKQRMVERQEREARTRERSTSSTASASSSSSSYIFRNAWDPPGMELKKKKLSIEDEEVEMALPLRAQRQDGRRELTFASFGGSQQTESSRGDGGISIEAAAQGGLRKGASWAGVSTTTTTTTTNLEEEDEEEVRGRHWQGASSVEGAAQRTEESIGGTRGVRAGLASLGTMVGAAGAAAAGSKASTTLATRATTTKMTPPGAIRFVKTTQTTTITRRRIVNGVVVETTTTTSTTGDQKEFELPPGPRELPYFKGARRSASITRAQEPSRLGTSHQTTSRTTTSTASFGTEEHDRSMTDNISRRHGSVSTSVTGKTVETSSHTSKATSAVQSTTTRERAHQVDDTFVQHGQDTLAEKTKSTSSSSIISKEEGHHESLARRRESKALPVLGIDTRRQSLQEHQYRERRLEQGRLDLGREEASAAAVEKAKDFLSKNPRATAISTKVAGKGIDLYAGDPNLQSATTATSSSHSAITKGKEKVMVLKDEDVVEETEIEEDIDELTYFGEQHTHAALPMGSPYMPSTPLIPGVQPRYPISGYSSRAASRPASRPVSRPSTPGSLTPSRYGPSTPKLGAYVSTTEEGIAGHARSQLSGIPPMSISSAGTASPTAAARSTTATNFAFTKDRRQSAEPDTGFSNYRIEWNWSELLGKKPRHWNDEEGEYDPYNALSTHGSTADSDEEDDRHLLDSSEEESEEDEDLSPTASSAGQNRFAQGEDNELARESGFVIRGGKIARRRSSMVLERRNL
ncbi:hypothetical protein BGZ73_005920 [Actinomortierella ambigua]|nr:hypothetical protein BGZ73_005920 [Actinomortierella ambigua]